MKFILFSISILLASISLGQAPKRDVLSIKQDTLSLCLSIYDGGRIVEKRFYRELESQRDIGPEDLFMRGTKRFQSLDSIAIYSYDQHWVFKERPIYRGKESVKHTSYRYSNEKFKILSNSIQVVDRSGSEAFFELIFKSFSPQDLDLQIIGADILTFQDTSITLINRKVDTTLHVVKIKHGINRFKLSIDNPNTRTKKVILETRGYDILDTDFTPTLKSTKEVTITGNEDIIIQVLGNNRLLKFESQTKQITLPVSKEHFILKRKLISTGSHLLELHNLNTGEVKMCRIKVL